MRTIIAGTRSLERDDIIAGIEQCPWWREITEVVCGVGYADRVGEKWAARKRIKSKRFVPDWDRYGSSAGPLRNQEMVEYAEALIAVWDGESPGTRDVIERATRRGLRVHVSRVGKLGLDMASE